MPKNGSTDRLQNVSANQTRKHKNQKKERGFAEKLERSKLHVTPIPPNASR